MDFKGIYRVTDKLVLATDKSVDQLERQIGFPLPVGYREYVTQLGEGDYCGELSVWLPKMVRQRLEHMRELHATYYEDFFLHWHKQPLRQEDVDQCVDLAGTANGDSFIACPRFPGVLFKLPRHDDKVRVIKTGFRQPKRLCFEGNWKPDFEYFEAHRPDHKHYSYRYESRATEDKLAALFAERFEKARTHWHWVGEGENRHVVLFVQALGAHANITRDNKLNQLGLSITLDKDQLPELKAFMAEARAKLSLVKLGARPPKPQLPKPKVTLKASRRPRVVPETFALEGHHHKVNCFAFSPDGKWLTSADSDVVKLWEVVSQQEIGALKGHKGLIEDLAFSPDGKVLASASLDHKVKLWDVARRKLLRTLSGHSGDFGGTKTVAFSPGGTQLISTGDDKYIRLWDTWTGKEILKDHVPDDNLCGAFFLEDGQPIGIRADCDRTFFWNVQTGRQLYVLETFRTVHEVFLSPDNKRLAVWSGTGVEIWELASARILYRLTRMPDIVRSVAFHPNQRHVAVGLQATDVWLWDIVKKRLVARLGKRGHTVRSLQFSPDGRFLAATSAECVLVWEWAKVV